MPSLVLRRVRRACSRRGRASSVQPHPPKPRALRGRVCSKEQGRDAVAVLNREVLPVWRTSAQLRGQVVDLGEWQIEGRHQCVNVGWWQGAPPLVRVITVVKPVVVACLLLFELGFQIMVQHLPIQGPVLEES